MNLGLLLPIEDAKKWMLAKGALQAARGRGISLRLLVCLPEHGFAQMGRTDFEAAFCFRPTDYEGLLVAHAGWALQTYAKYLHDSGFPIFLLARRLEGAPFVANNDCEAVRGRVQALYEKGHRAIAFLAGPADDAMSEDRMSGYWQGLLDCGLEVDDRLILRGDLTEATAQHLVQGALEAEVHFSALIGVNDPSALGALTALTKAGLSAGSDVEVLGFGNLPRSQWSRPSLSTFDTGPYQIGYLGCEQLCRKVLGENFDSETLVPVRFVARRSSWEVEEEAGSLHPLALEYQENRFLYDAQLDLLRRDPQSAQVLGALESSLGSHESHLQAVRETLGELARHGFGVCSLSSYLTYLEGRDARVSQATSEASRSLLTAALLNEQKQAAELSQRYQMAVARLRELPLASASEDHVLEAWKQALRLLEVQRAGLFLLSDPGRSSCGSWHAWSVDRAEPEVPEIATAFDGIWLDSQGRELSWMLVPLQTAGEHLGLVALDTESAFLEYLPDLVRQFSVALRAARLQAALARANADLVEASRLAGLAEMATGVLHNIGNALNGLNTACGLSLELVRKSRSGGVARAAKLLEEHRGDLGTFLAQDPRGRQLPDYLGHLGKHLLEEREALERELGSLRSMTDHINQIVAAQQAYAKVADIEETMAPVDLFENALRLSEAALVRHGIQVLRDYPRVPSVRVQRQKALQILENLIRNAKEAMTDQAVKQLQLGLRQEEPGLVQLRLTDTGTGIASENLLRIFQFGFSTKKGGRGFGLHTSALAAKEMRGSLQAESGGPGKGACFILTLPLAAGA